MMKFSLFLIMMLVPVVSPCRNPPPLQKIDDGGVIVGMYET